jgi:predicted nucleotidyltransferase
MMSPQLQQIVQSIDQLSPSDRWEILEHLRGHQSLDEIDHPLAQHRQSGDRNCHMTHHPLNLILSTLRDYLQRIYGNQLVHLILFGSQARQEANADSDIDILVVLNRSIDAWTENEWTATFISELCLEYGIRPVRKMNFC